MSILDKLQTINKSLKIDGGVGLKTYTAEEINALTIPEGMTVILADTDGNTYLCTSTKKVTIGNKINRYTFTVTNFNADYLSSVLYNVLAYSTSIKSIKLEGIDADDLNFTCTKAEKNQESNTTEFQFIGLYRPTKNSEDRVRIVNYEITVQGSTSVLERLQIINLSSAGTEINLVEDISPHLTITYMSDRDLSI